MEKTLGACLLLKKLLCKGQNLTNFKVYKGFIPLAG